MEAVGTAGVVMVLVYVILFAFYGLMYAFLIVQYILSSLSLYKVGKKEKIANPGLAWLPVATDWVLGSIVDEYDERKGQKKNLSKVLLILSIVAVGGTFVMFAVCYVMIFIVALGAVAGEEIMLGSIVVFGGIFYVLVLVMGTAASALGMLRAVCMYKIFENLAPEKTLKYFLLYLFVPLAGPICLLKCVKESEVEEVELAEIEEIEAEETEVEDVKEEVTEE